ncbi:NADP-dependent oxidoreductase domain-containing protein, partial [Ochromonadaceae sp. CCMP2298]
GLGTQRWVSGDSNAPDEKTCFSFMDRAILDSGVNLIDTAEQYPIPSGSSGEGAVESLIGRWMQQRNARDKTIIATKITGGSNVNARNLVGDLEGSLRRLKTDYVDIYQLHWPARYTPQANWGQSLQYHSEVEPYYKGVTSFEDTVLAMGQLLQQGKIRAWGLCNDNAFGLTSLAETARRLGIPGPVSMQNDFSLLDRRSEENGVSEASSPIHLNVGFMGYNTLAGGVLTGKYLESPPPYDLPGLESAAPRGPRGRHDMSGWGRTLYRYRSGPADIATRQYALLAQKYGLSLTELSLLWCRRRSGLTTALVAQTSMKQLDEDLRIFQMKKGLTDELMWEVDRIHMQNRLPIFSSTRVGRDWAGEGEIGEVIP